MPLPALPSVTSGATGRPKPQELAPWTRRVELQDTKPQDSRTGTSRLQNFRTSNPQDLRTGTSELQNFRTLRTQVKLGEAQASACGLRFCTLLSRLLRILTLTSGLWVFTLTSGLWDFLPQFMDSDFAQRWTPPVCTLQIFTFGLVSVLEDVCPFVQLLVQVLFAYM